MGAASLLTRKTPTGKAHRHGRNAEVLAWAKQLGVTDVPMGIPATGAIGIAVAAGQPSDGDTVTVTGPVSGAVIYEADSNSSVTAGNVSVTIGASVKATITSLVAAINANQPDLKATLSFLAAPVTSASANIKVIDKKSVADGAGITLAKTGSKFTVNDHANEAARANLQVFTQSRVPSAQEVDEKIMTFDFGVADVVGMPIVQVITTATGSPVLWAGLLTISSTKQIVLTNDGDTDWSANETVTVMALCKVTGNLV